MNRARPRLIVSLPGRTVAELAAQCAQSAQDGADLAEVRVDRLDAEEMRPLDRWARAPGALPLIATYRSRAEGGEGLNAGEERRSIVDRLHDLPFRFVDLEVAADRETIRERDPRRGRILSVHLEPGASLARFEEAIRTEPPLDGFVKVVLSSSVERLYREVRPALERLEGDRRIVLTTGPSGPILRIRPSPTAAAAVYVARALGPAESATGTAESVEATQPPLDVARRFFAAEDRGRAFALLGHPVAHSISPRLHDLWYLGADLPGIYVALDIASAEEFEAVLPALARDGFAGVNVTHPWKDEALRAADRASPEAVSAGCANTLTVADGGWSADNFDVRAVRRRAEELRESGRWDGKEMLVLGGGGAARATLAAARDLGCRARVLVRRPEAARELARRFGALPEEDEGRPYSLVVHATPCGRRGSATLELAWEGHVGPGTHLLDFVHAPDSGDLASRTRRRGGSYEDGGRLLVYQAIEAHTRWWGAPPPPPLIERALREAGCAA